MRARPQVVSGNLISELPVTTVSCVITEMNNKIQRTFSLHLNSEEYLCYFIGTGIALTRKTDLP